MALIKCSECSKEISDKASACPGCGCPVAVLNELPDCKQHSVLNNFKDNYIATCGGKYAPQKPIDKHIIEKYHDSDEARYARTQSTIGSTVKPSATFTESSQPDSPEIPTGLYWATAILGFPLGTGMAIGFNIGANSRIKKGDYAKAQKYIDSTKIACWVIIVPCAIAMLLLLSMCSMIFR